MLLEISLRQFDPDKATNAQHVRALYGESLRNASDDSTQVREKIALVDLLKGRVKAWAQDEIRTRMVMGVREKGYSQLVKTWKDVRQLCIDDDSLEC